MFKHKALIVSITCCVWLLASPSTAMAQDVTGSGTTGKIPVWTSATNQGSSVLTQNGSSLGIGTDTPQATLHVNQSGPQWGSWNFGTNLLVSGGGRHPTLGVLDANGANPWALTNSFGKLLISQMPAPGTTSGGPERRLAIDTNGNVSIGHDTPKGAVHIANNSAGWSSWNYGTNLLITPGGPVRHPTLGLFDADGGRPWAISNVSGSWMLSQMPALGNTTDGPVHRLSVDASGNVAVGSRTVIDSTGKWVGDPTGLVGPKGDPGPAVSTSAVCYVQGNVCSLTCSGRVVASMSAPCQVTSDTGTCTNNLSSGWCCVCAP